MFDSPTLFRKSDLCFRADEPIDIPENGEEPSAESVSHRPALKVEVFLSEPRCKIVDRDARSLIATNDLRPRRIVDRDARSLIATNDLRTRRIVDRDARSTTATKNLRPRRILDRDARLTSAMKNLRPRRILDRDARLTSAMKNLRPRNIVYIGEEDGETSTTTKRRPKNSSNMKRKNQV
jgi:hypothetical protein